jgi:hypothetical protein
MRTEFTLPWWFMSSCLACLAVIADIGLTNQVGNAAEEDSISINRIIAAYGSRSAKVRTVKVRWTARKLVPKVAHPTRTGPNDFESLHKATEKHVQAGQAVFGHQRLRLTLDGMLWTNDVYLRKRTVFVNDGKTYKTFFGRSPDDEEDFPLGSVGADNGNPMAVVADILPIMLVFRSSSKELREFVNLSTFSVSGQATVKGRKCVEIRSQFEHESQVRLWLDVERRFVPLLIRRVQLREKGDLEVCEETYVSYTVGDFGMWVPSSWGFIQYAYRPQDSAASRVADRLISFKVEANVEECEINPELADEDFQLEFPVGTYVNDAISGESYIVREGGEKRTITRAEMRPDISYAQLAATESGQAVPALESSSGRALLWINIVLFVVLGAIFVVRRSYRAANA